MVLFHRTLRYLWKSTKPVNVNCLLRNVGAKLFATEAQLIEKPTVRSLYAKKKKKKDETDPAAYYMLVIPITTFGLGVWQIFRKIEKNEMIKDLKIKSNTPPVDLPKNLNELKDMEFQAVRVKGKFDHSKEIYIGPRPINNAGGGNSSLISAPKGGYLVITPFTLSDRNLTIHVNRGWVPGEKKSPSKRKEGQITGEVELVGLVRLSEKRSPLGMKNQPEKGFWIYRDLEAMSEVTKAAPILIEAVESSSVPGGPIGGQTVVTLKDDHLIYIVTWFGMSFLTGWMWYIRYVRKLTTAHGFHF